MMERRHLASRDKQADALFLAFFPVKRPRVHVRERSLRGGETTGIKRLAHGTFTKREWQRREEDSVRRGWNHCHCTGGLNVKTVMRNGSALNFQRRVELRSGLASRTEHGRAAINFSPWRNVACVRRVIRISIFSVPHCRTRASSDYSGHYAQIRP